MKDLRIPANIEAEKILLGILLMGDEEAWDEVNSLLQPEDFFQSAHKKIFQEVKKLYQSGLSADVVTLGDSLKKSGELESVGGVAYLGDLIHEIPSTGNITSYMEILREKSVLRKLIKTSQNFIDTASKENFQNINVLLDLVESEILNLGNTRTGSEPLPIGSLVEDGLKKFGTTFS